MSFVYVMFCQWESYESFEKQADEEFPPDLNVYKI